MLRLDSRMYGNPTLECGKGLGEKRLFKRDTPQSQEEKEKKTAYTEIHRRTGDERIISTIEICFPSPFVFVLHVAVVSVFLILRYTRKQPHSYLRL